MTRPFSTFRDCDRLFAGKHLLRLADAHVVYVLVGLMFMAGAAAFVHFADFAHLPPKDVPDRLGVRRRDPGLPPAHRYLPDPEVKGLVPKGRPGGDDGGVYPPVMALTVSDPRGGELPMGNGCGLCRGDLPHLGLGRKKRRGYGPLTGRRPWMSMRVQSLMRPGGLGGRPGYVGAEPGLGRPGS